MEPTHGNINQNKSFEARKDRRKQRGNRDGSFEISEAHLTEFEQPDVRNINLRITNNFSKNKMEKKLTQVKLVNKTKQEEIKVHAETDPNSPRPILIAAENQ